MYGTRISSYGRSVTGKQSLWPKAEGSHIDTAWLWCYSHTQQKIARSWSTQVDLIKRYPDYHFAASSAQQYVWLQELYPSLYNEVKEQIAADRFHPVGGAWLEHDCLIPSGESLCRQYLYGQRYFERQFGKRCREAWLPDTFGYASQLPQILRLAGIDFFFTQKVREPLNHGTRVPLTGSCHGTTSTPSRTPHSIGLALTEVRSWRT